MPAVLPPARFHGVRHHMPAHGVLAQQGSRQRGGRSLPTRLVPYPIHFLYGHRLASPAKAVSFLYVEGLIVWDHLSGYFRMHGSVSLPPACPCQGGHAIRQILDYVCNLLKINA